MSANEPQLVLSRESDETQKELTAFIIIKRAESIAGGENIALEHLVPMPGSSKLSRISGSGGEK